MFDEKFKMRFWSYVFKKEKDECWEWMGTKMHEGYGTIGFNKKNLRAHRVSWMIANNKSPVQSILHKCNNRSCVNPSHLEDGTHTQNMLDMRKAGTVKGEKNPFSKLTEATVREIRKERERGLLHREIAAKIGVHKSTVTLVLSGKTWSHVI